MAYSAKADILKQLDESILIQLTDEEGTGLVDDDKVDRAITDADSTIDFYCQKRYAVPLSPVPDKIRNISVDIAIYNLFSLKADTMPDTRKDRFNRAIDDLKLIAKGTVELGASTPAPANTRDSVSIEANPRVFTRDNMRGF